MAKILLDYVFPISVIEPTPAASTAFLKQALVVVKPKAGQEGNVGQVYECATMTQVSARTDNQNAQQLFNAGMNRVFILLADDLEIATYVDANLGDFWTILISDDFGDADLSQVTVPAIAAAIKIEDILFTAKTAGAAGNAITLTYTDTLSDGTASVTSVVGSAITVAIEAGVTPASAIATAIAGDVDANALVSTLVDTGDEADPQAAHTATNLTGGADETTTAGALDVGTFDGVVGFSSEDANTCQTFGTAPLRCGFFRGPTTGAKNMFFAFGKLLSNLTSWTNQQYIAMPFNDGVGDLGTANSLFDDRVSFVLNDTEFGNRLALFVAGGKAIAAPYIGKNLRVDLQSQALTWISANQPDYTLVNAALLEDTLQTKVIQAKYIDTKWITDGVIEIKLIQDNFVSNGYINIAEPKALWRVVGEMRSTL